jgi:hypothetical protein
MKRTNVVLDEDLLEEARRATGEKTYSATINTALEEIVKRRNFRRAFDAVSQLAAKGEFFYPGFIEEEWPQAAAVKKKRSAHVKRVATPKKAARRVRR